MPSSIDYAKLTPSESRRMREALRAELEAQMGYWENTPPIDDPEGEAGSQPSPASEKEKA